MNDEQVSEFTMVFIDLDDTLIPSTIRRNIYSHLGIDIFETLSSTLLKKLQYSIIKTIDTIQKVLLRKNNPISIAIVSDSKSKRIQSLLKNPADDSQPAKFPILAKYLMANNIALHSAIDEMFHFLQAKYNYDKPTAETILSHSKTDKEDTQWTWKYITFSGILLQHKQRQRKQCTRIISLGDGAHEGTALLEYAKRFRIQCDHIKFLKYPTIYQLNQQWKHIQDHFEDIIIRKANTRSLALYDMNQVFECDNNRYCSGASDQITAIGTYFQLWLNNINECYAAEYVTKTLKDVCSRVQKRMVTIKKMQHLSNIVLYLRENKQFDIAFIRQIVSNEIGEGDIS